MKSSSRGGAKRPVDRSSCSHGRTRCAVKGTWDRGRNLFSRRRGNSSITPTLFSGSKTNRGSPREAPSYAQSPW